MNKAQLKAGLVLLSISFAADATNEILEDQLSSALKQNLSTLDVDFQDNASTETLLEAYTLATNEDGSGDKSDEENQDNEFFEFTAKVGFKQPWKDGVFSKKINDEFDEDDEKLITHLLSNNLIKRN